MKTRDLKNIVKHCVKNLALLFTESTLYPDNHPSVISQLKQTFMALEAVLKQVDPFYIDILEESFVFEGIPLYEIKHIAEKAAQMLEAKKISRIYFAGCITPQGLNSFIQLVLDKSKDYSFAELQRALQNMGITHIRIEQSDLAAGVEEWQKMLQPKHIYGASIEATKLIYNTVQTGKTIPLDLVSKMAKNITTMVAKDTFVSIALTNLRDYDDYVFTHSTNVAILSVALATNILNNATLLHRFAQAAILHDIGQALIPPEILNKPDKLSDKETKIMQQHPLLGAKLLEQQDQVDKLAVLIAAEHQMKYDLSGYPKIEGITQLHPLSLIVNIISTYDAITSKRIYKNPLPADKALSVMMRLIGCDFQPQFFKIFVQMMGIYPPGSFVRLDSQEVGITKQVNPGALLLPEIKIILDAQGKVLDEMLLVDLSDQEGSVSPRAIQEIIDPGQLDIDPLDFI